ncbi:hypothetical protein GmHk_U060076 [Glycine max]|nr:hypothetical protein GmHk_U060076 [Glycine max]
MEQCSKKKSAKWIRNLGKRIGSEGWARGSPDPASCRWTARAASGGGVASRAVEPVRAPWGLFPGVEQSTRASTDKGIDCLIKTKHCDGPCGC